MARFFTIGDEGGEPFATPLQTATHKEGAVAMAVDYARANPGVSVYVLEVETALRGFVKLVPNKRD